MTYLNFVVKTLLQDPNVQYPTAPDPSLSPPEPILFKRTPNRLPERLSIIDAFSTGSFVTNKFAPLGHSIEPIRFGQSLSTGMQPVKAYPGLGIQVSPVNPAEPFRLVPVENQAVREFAEVFDQTPTFPGTPTDFRPQTPLGTPSRVFDLDLPPRL